MRGETRPLYVVNAAAPVRICDNGGWTDTWFAAHGRIFNIAVSPYATVQVEVYPYDGQGPQVIIHAENYGQRYPRVLGAPWDHHPLLEATIEKADLPRDRALQVTVHSDAPAGASTGTSAAVTVALLGALDHLTPGRRTPHEIAYAAQSIETDVLGQQCGIQDQLCAAYGGVNYIEMFDYPHATVSPIRLPRAVEWELERRLALIFLGRAHQSSAIHERVIRHLEDAGPTAPPLERLRATAGPSRDALYAGDFAALGRAMVENTEAQRALHPELVSAEAQQVIDVARAHGALGWKVNGAGGSGGSLTLLCGPRSSAKRIMIREMRAVNPLLRQIPIRLSRHGLRTWVHSLDHQR
jgi:D-glycero-alpha-D-manno-heptose-7-phosphate kinase